MTESDQMPTDAAAADIIEDNPQEINPSTEFGKLMDLTDDGEIAIAVEDWLDECE